MLVPASLEVRCARPVFRTLHFTSERGTIGLLAVIGKLSSSEYVFLVTINPGRFALVQHFLCLIKDCLFLISQEKHLFTMVVKIGING